MSGRGKTIKEWRRGVKYNKVSTIGKGAFVTVYKVLDKYNGIPYIAKELEKRRTFLETSSGKYASVDMPREYRQSSAA